MLLMLLSQTAVKRRQNMKVGTPLYNEFGCDYQFLSSHFWRRVNVSK